MSKKGLERFIVLFLPWIFATLYASEPFWSYMIAWSGSFLILLISLTGWVKRIPDDRPFGAQLMRPLFLMQIIFAGYMSCSSIFYFINLYGYVDFEKLDPYFVVDEQKLMLTAQCQRYYCLGHAALVLGILTFMHYPDKKKYLVEQGKLANLLMVIAFSAYPISIAFMSIPGLSQFYYQFSTLSFIAGTLALAFAIPAKKAVNTAACGMLYGFNLYSALLSGYKEPIIVSILVLGVFLYPNYKKFVLATFIPLLFFAFIVLPTYVANFRGTAWSGDADAEQSAQIALDAALQENHSNWTFLAFRLSEIGMFTTFANSTPSNVKFYGTTIVKQSAIAIVPRALWPAKPVTEDMVMQRVYDAGVVNPLSNVSAKPPYIVDAYLSAGGTGVFWYLFLYGALAQLISVKAEQLFGGYVLGTALIFSGLFQIFWRGLSFEFISNNIFWSYVSMLVIHRILVWKRVLTKVQ